MATTPPTLALPYSTAQAFKLGDRIYETERGVLIDAIREALDASDTVRGVAMAFPADRIYETASALLPLLQRAIAVRSVDNAKPAPLALTPVAGPLDRNGFDTTPRKRSYLDRMEEDARAQTRPEEPKAGSIGEAVLGAIAVADGIIERGE